MSYVNLDDHIHASNIPVIPDIASRFLRLYDNHRFDHAACEQLRKQYPDFFKRLLTVINLGLVDLIYHPDLIDKIVWV